MSGGSTGRWPPFAGLAAPPAAAAAATEETVGAVPGTPPARDAAGAAAFRGSMRVLIWLRVRGPRRYDIAHRVSNTSGASS